MADPLRDGDPARIGPYRLEGRLGGGGMGRVFLGRSPGGHRVAVKVVRPELAEDEDFRRRFATEVRAARRVGGFYTAPVVDADPEGDPPWLATAYVPGPSLHRVVADRGPLPAEEAAALGAGLAEGLAAVHAQGIVHRDLKPANVLLSGEGPRLIDFGIARALDTTSYTRTATVLGTASFMSPEQVRAERVGPESDVFSLGCLLVFAATGHGPFGEGPGHAVAYRIVHEQPDLSGLPGALAEVVRDCLAKDPGARPDPGALTARLAALAPVDGRTVGGGWQEWEGATEVLPWGGALRPTAVVTEAGGGAGRTPGSGTGPEPDGRTARRAVGLARSASLGSLVIVVLAIVGLLFPGAPTWAIVVNLVAGLIEAPLLFLGAWWLSRRREAGRRTVIRTGVAVSVHGASIIVQVFFLGGPWSLALIAVVFGLVSAGTAAGAVAAAAHPDTGRWCSGGAGAR
ncbi:serine/threonine-protein kinase [Nocardiopsis sp. CC223A]|uniref:serine/threonine-protein kinase n=1 Tax=Nocardiopsis sp. CC223A TaxID=3044051 RepID=UPI00278C86AA|nr:serine/threonine-protein kinase [Nocardiopsis sp. CC223A]